MTTERIVFRLIVCPSCSHQLCWVNPRLPTYCPECGEFIMARVREAIHVRDDNATITYNVERKRHG